MVFIKKNNRNQSLNAATYEAISPEHPYHDIYTYYTGTIGEAVDNFKQKGLLDKGFIPMKSDEIKRFKNAVFKIGDANFAFEQIKDKLDYTRYIEGDESVNQITYDFWYAGARDATTAAIQYGADVVGDHGYDLSKRAKAEGKHSFGSNYSKIKGGRFETYSDLVFALRQEGVKFEIASEEDCIKACNEGGYCFASVIYSPYSF